MNIIVLVMAFLMGFSPNTVRWVLYTEERETPFSELPAECCAVYDEEIKEFRQAVSTRTFLMDIDGNGTQELFVYNGESGSGGEGWGVFEYNGQTYVSVGNIFGYAGKFVDAGQHGLLVNHRCGWQTRLYDFYQLKDGKLVLLAQYREDLSDCPEKDQSRKITYIRP